MSILRRRVISLPSTRPMLIRAGIEFDTLVEKFAVLTSGIFPSNIQGPGIWGRDYMTTVVQYMRLQAELPNKKTQAVFDVLVQGWYEGISKYGYVERRGSLKFFIPI